MYDLERQTEMTVITVTFLLRPTSVRLDFTLKHGQK